MHSKPKSTKHIAQHIQQKAIVLQHKSNIKRCTEKQTLYKEYVVLVQHML